MILPAADNVVQMCPMKITQDQIKKLFSRLYEEIGGESNPDIRTYRERPSIITRNAFFRESVWAIWVAGKSRVSADSFLGRAFQKGFIYDFQVIASWSESQQTQFIESLHGWTTEKGRPRSRPVPRGAKGRWGSIFFIAKELAKYPTDKAFQEKFFEGKTEGALLDISDIRRLVSLNIPYLKEVTAQFLVKNMGAEAIKADRWVNEFLHYYDLSKYELEQLLINARIPLGCFDTVLWCYCEMFVHEVMAFQQHFENSVFET